MKQSALPFAFDDLPTSAVLQEHHYLGACGRARLTYRDRFGVIVFAAPASRHLPRHWLELSRWCLVGERNGGSRQWAAARRWLAEQRHDVTTVVSYSDLSVGHTGALYRACNWLWAPTWHRLCPPPTGFGSWDGRTTQAVKDRWIWVVRPDEERLAVLALKDSYERRFQGASYREPKFRRGVPIGGTGGGDYQRWGRKAER